MVSVNLQLLLLLVAFVLLVLAAFSVANRFVQLVPLALALVLAAALLRLWPP